MSNCPMTKAISVNWKSKVPFFKYWSSMYCYSTNCTLQVAEQHLPGGFIRRKCPGIMTPDSVESLLRRFRMSASFFASRTNYCDCSVDWYYITITTNNGNCFSGWSKNWTLTLTRGGMYGAKAKAGTLHTEGTGKLIKLKTGLLALLDYDFKSYG